MPCLVNVLITASMLRPIPTGSVTGNLRLAKHGDALAFEWLWHRYYKSIVLHLETISKKKGLKPIEPEDVAQNVFIALHEGLKHGAFDALDGRYQLWKLLTIIGLRQAINSARKEALDRRSIQNSAACWQSLIDQRSNRNIKLAQIDKSFYELTLKEEVEYGLSILDKEFPSQRLRELAILKMKGYSNTRIAEEFGWTRKTVAIRLNLIFEIWKEASEA